MKKYLAIVLFTLMGLSGGVNAAFVESATGNASYNLTFSGTILDVRPVWVWEIPDASKTAMTGLSALVINGIQRNGSTTFTFPSKDAVTLIHGYMKGISAMGGIGLTPVIKVGNDGSTVTMNGTTQAVTVVATGTISGTAVAAGTMRVNATAYLGGALFDGTAAKYFGATQAQTLLADNQTGFTTIYPSIAEGTSTFAQAEALLANQASTKISGAYSVSIDDYTLMFPSGSLPDTWAAIIPVTVTLK
ncbi:F4 family fimbrial subunit [Vibrio panuliri]|uniref:Fimbrial protein n=1 Tax=Vibrio panuliri TaxID=1381081 RepID=A0ABX3F480_9VIBR|nr:fimbrial protein [Vibrio panuliri]KAB1457262.1 fimbrial protein [Vibrio panuliri]OLQ84739.1 hypothetical protein BIY20_17120 [Vibrio panuliri]